MDIRLLGPLSLDNSGAGMPGPRDRVVLSALALRPGEVFSQDQLADALWGEQPPESSAKVVQGCVMRLRKCLGGNAIETMSDGYRLVVGSHDLDTRQFEELLSQGRDQAAAGSADRAAMTLARALALWRGRPFPDLGEWDPGRHEAARLTELHLSAQEDLLAARLSAGEHADVAAEAVTMVAEEPWRERRWAILALAQYRSGRQADALASIRLARRKLGSQLGIDPGSELVDLERAILAQDPALAASGELGRASLDCPYKGLASYLASDSDTFFGRDDEIASCLQRIQQTPLLVLAGPSGSGKSSLLRAGLLPRLARSRRVALFLPGNDPQAAMAEAIATEPGVDPVLAVDQFEEAFTLGADAGMIRRWLGDLAAYAAHRAPVIITVRADHLAGLSVEPTFARRAEQGLHLIAALTGDALRSAIERPAQVCGLRLEPGLVDLLLRDAEGEPGSLPLLSHALAETWRRRDGRVLTVEGYLSTGGIRGAVARSADRLYEGLPVDQRQTLRWVMLRLVSTSAEGEPVRTRVRLDTVRSDPDRVRVIDMLVRARLVTTEEATLELAHEALARVWPRLRSWLDEDAAGQRILRHLSAAADGWDALGRPPSELYRGARLDTAHEWAATAGASLTPLERNFLQAAEANAASERQVLVSRAREQTRQNRRLRALLGGTAALLGISLIAGFAAVDSSRQAGQERDAANSARRTTLHESIVNRSLALRATNRSLAALLAVEAYRQAPDPLARSALMGTFTASPGFMGYQPLPGEFSNGTLLPGTSTAVLALDGRDLRMLDLDTGETADPFPAPPEHALGYSTLKVSADNAYVAQLVSSDTGVGCGGTDSFAHHDGRGCTSTAVYSLRTGKLVFGPTTTPFSGADVALNADGSLLAVTGGSNGDLVVYDVPTGRSRGQLEGLPRPPDRDNFRDTGTVTFDDAGRLYLGSMDGPIREVDPRNMEVVRTLPAPTMSSHNYLFLTTDGDLVASGDDAIVAIDVQSGRREWAVHSGSDEFPEVCTFMGVAEAVGRIYCGDYFGSIEERDLRTGQLTGVTLDPQLGSVGDLAVSADGRELLAFAAVTPVVSRWRLDGSGPVSRLVAAGRVITDGYNESGMVPTSERDAVGTPEDRVAIWDPEADKAVARIPAATDAVWFGPATVSPLWTDGSTDLYDLDGSRRFDAEQVPADAAGLWRSPDGRMVFVAIDGDDKAWSTYTIRAYDSATMEQIGAPVSVDAYFVETVSGTADHDRLVATVQGRQEAVTHVFDPRTGVGLAAGLQGIRATAVSARDVLIGADVSAGITEFDLGTLEPLATYPGARGMVRSLQFSADGSELLVASADQTVQVYDVSTRFRLGDPIDTSSPNLISGWLRPSGQEIAVNARSGVVVWDIGDASLVEAGCRLAGRNLTATEWDTYLRDVSDYRQTCPEFD